MNIQKRLESNFALYRKKGAFVDCTISFEDHDISVHKIILAKFSNYFLNAFVESEQNPFIFKPIYNPQDMLEKVIDFFYENTIDSAIFEKNLIAFLAISRYYQIEILEELVTDILPERTKKETALNFCQKCVEFNIQDQAKYFAPTIAENWNYYGQEKIFKNVDATVLSLILKDDHMANFSQDAKIQIIDKFINFTNASINDSEKGSLTSTINWSGEDAYQYLTRHDCSWIHPRVARPLVKRVMKERRSSIVNLSDELKQTNLSEPEENSKWYLFTRMINIQQANSKSEDDNLVIPVINYISTYGNLIEGYDPIKAGALSVDSTPPMDKAFDVNYALGTYQNQSQEYYFITIGKKGMKPFYEIDFGANAKLLANELEIVCSSTKILSQKLKSMNKNVIKPEDVDRIRQNPVSIEVIGYLSDSNKAVTLYKGEFSEKIPISRDFGPLSKIKFIQTHNNAAGNNILRLFKVEILGEFVL